MPHPSHHPRWLLRRSHQIVIAALVVVALAITGGWWACQGGWKGELTEIDRAGRLTPHFEVDINTADRPELMQLPGVGQSTADRILESRQNKGPFASNDDLQRVKGIGPKTLERIRPYLTPTPSRLSSSQ